MQLPATAPTWAVALVGILSPVVVLGACAAYGQKLVLRAIAAEWPAVKAIIDAGYAERIRATDEARARQEQLSLEQTRVMAQMGRELRHLARQGRKTVRALEHMNERQGEDRERIATALALLTHKAA